MNNSEFNAIFEKAKQVRVDFVGDETKALRPWPALDLRIARAMREVVIAERERCERMALITVRAGDSSVISITGKLIAEAIRNGDAP